MATTPTPSPAPPSKLDNILRIINFSLQGLSVASSFTPFGAAVAGGIKLEQLFQGLLTNALQAYHAEVGQPFDLSKIPFEAPVT
jgi:hypothetical protein